LDEWQIYFVGLLSAFSDVATSWACSQFPELVERNPLANPFLEAASVLGSQALILHLGEAWKVDPNVRVALALLPPIVPFAAAANNLYHLAIVILKRYPTIPAFVTQESQEDEG
jgi:hypothetical protein